MIRIKQTNSGFTLSELLVGTIIMVGVLSVLMGSYITMQKLFPGGINQVMHQAYGRDALSKISSSIRQSMGASLSGDTLTLITDPSNTFNNTLDDITISYSISSGEIEFDPDTTVASNERILVENVTPVSGIPYFQINGNLVVVTFAISTNSSLLGEHSATLTTTVKMRNVP